MLKRIVTVALVLMPSLAWAQDAAVLNQVLEAVRTAYNKQERPMVIFDLEGTLFDNRTRNLHIIKEYGERELKGVRPQFATLTANLTLSQMQYSVGDTLRAIGVTEEAVVSNAAVFWAERFYTDEYLKHDVPTAGAVNYVRSLYSAGARIVYLTGRDAQRQLLGTVKSLRDQGLPIGLQASELIMRPTQGTQDAIFKQQVMNYLRHYGKVIAAFDSETGNINNFRRAFPDAVCVLFNTLRAPNAPPLIPNVVTISAFQ